MKVFQLATHIQSGYEVTYGSNFHTHVVKKNGSLFFRGGGKDGSIRKSQKELEKTKKKHTHLNPENNFCNLTLNMNIPCYWKESLIHIHICLCILQNIFFWYDRRTIGISNVDYILITYCHLQTEICYRVTIAPQVIILSFF